MSRSNCLSIEKQEWPEISLQSVPQGCQQGPEHSCACGAFCVLTWFCVCLISIHSFCKSRTPSYFSSRARRQRVPNSRADWLSASTLSILVLENIVKTSVISDPVPATLQGENQVDYRVPQFQGKPRVRLMHKQACGTCKSSIHDHHRVILYNQLKKCSFQGKPN